MAVKYHVIGEQVTIQYDKEGAVTEYTGIVEKYDNGKNGPYLVLKTDKGFRSFNLDKIVG